jgi:hypothetical protein
MKSSWAVSHVDMGLGFTVSKTLSVSIIKGPMAGKNWGGFLDISATSFRHEVHDRNRRG